MWCLLLEGDALARWRWTALFNLLTFRNTLEREDTAIEKNIGHVLIRQDLGASDAFLTENFLVDRKGPQSLSEVLHHVVNTTVWLVTLTNKVETRGKERMFVQLSFFRVTALQFKLAVQSAEFDSTSSVTTWGWLNRIFVLHVVVRQCQVIFEFSFFKN